VEKVLNSKEGACEAKEGGGVATARRRTERWSHDTYEKDSRGGAGAEMGKNGASFWPEERVLWRRK